MYSVRTVGFARAIGCRPIRSLLCTYPLMCHSHFIRHRAFSHGVSSFRAIPIDKVIAAVERDVAMPAEWRKNQPGMVAGELLPPEVAAEAKRAWYEAAVNAVASARKLQVLGCHKEEVNRLLAPFSYVRHLITSTEWDNFLRLRCAGDADPTTRKISHMIRVELEKGTPRLLASNEWYTPFMTTEDAKAAGGWTDPDELLRKASVACAARTSYRMPGDERVPTAEDNARTFEKLLNPGNFHPSPFEHVARPLPPSERTRERERNFRDWEPWRVEVEKRYAAYA